MQGINEIRMHRARYRSGYFAMVDCKRAGTLADDVARRTGGLGPGIGKTEPPPPASSRYAAAALTRVWCAPKNFLGNNLAGITAKSPGTATIELPVDQFLDEFRGRVWSVEG
jgi:hypothetical protein